MAGPAKGELLSIAEVGPTTPRNTATPKGVAHVDDLALQVDFLGVNIGNTDPAEMGRYLLHPRVPGAARSSLIQANNGGYLVANVNILGRNYFPFNMKVDDHHAPRDWSGLMRNVDNQRRHEEAIMEQAGDVYVRPRTQEELDLAMRTPGKIVVVNTLEGFPQRLTHVPLTTIVDDLVSRDIGQVSLWNGPNAAGAAHDKSRDSGLSKRGRGVAEALSENGIVLDTAHASPRSSMELIDIAEERGGRAMNSHTGARIGSVVNKSRNTTDTAASRLLKHGWKVGVVLSSGMLGGNELDRAVDAFKHFGEMDPTGGDNLIYGGDFNGISLGTQIDGATTVVDLENLGVALQASRSFTRRQVEGISMMNYYRHVRDGLPAAA